MSFPTNPTRRVGQPLCRLDQGLELLDRWSPTASQAERNGVYKALFAVVDGSVRDTHIVFDESSGEGAQFTVVVREDLVVGVRVHGPDSFEVTHVGAPG